MRLLAAAVAGLLLVLAPASAAAGDGPDLIPQDLLGERPGPARRADATLPAPPQQAPSVPRAPSTLRRKLFVEGSFSGWSPAVAVPVPYPSSLVLDWQNRTSVDAAIHWKARPWLTLTLSDRLDVFEQSGQPLVSADTISARHR